MVQSGTTQPPKWVWYAGFALVWPAVALILGFPLGTLAWLLPWDVLGWVVRIIGMAAMAWVVARLAYGVGAPRALWVVVALFSAAAVGVILVKSGPSLALMLAELLYWSASPAAFMYESRRSRRRGAGTEQALQPDASSSVH